MNGFLLHQSNGPLSTSELPRQLLPFEDIPPAARERLSPDVELFTWGSDPGDVHVSHQKGLSLLVLNGYLSEVSCLPPFSSQQEACDTLRAHLDADHSDNVFRDVAAAAYGSFSFAYLSLKDQTIYSTTDRMASRPLWFRKTPDDVYVSSHAIPIVRLSDSSHFSPGEIASYLLYGNSVDPTRSLFSDLSSQNAGSLLSHSARRGLTETRWYAFQHTPDQRRSLRSWVKSASDLYVKAAERVLKTTSHPLLFLSGGVDSRLAGSALVAAGGTPLLCSLGDSNNLEIKIAKRVAKALRCQQTIILRDEEWYLRAVAPSMFSSDGMYSWIHSHFSEAYASLQESNNVDAAILGDLCEAFSKLFCTCGPERKQLWSEEEFVTQFDSLPLPNYRPTNREKTLCLLREDFRQSAKSQLAENIRRRYAAVSSVSKDPRIVGDHFFRWQTASCLPTFQMFTDVRSAGPERNLMFDNDLHALLEIMPSTVRANKDLGSRLVHRLCPRAARVPNANSLLPLMFPSFLHSLAKMTKPKLGKIRRFLFSNSYQTTASWPHLPLLYAGHASWKKQIGERLLDHATLAPEIFDHASVEQCWRDFCAGDLTLHADVERLFGLATLAGLLK